MTPPASVAVVIPAGGRDAHLRRLLLALADQSRPADEVVVADMGDARAVLATSPIATKRRPVTVSGDSLPLAAARNAGAAASDTDVLVFLDTDCLPYPDLVADYAHALAPGVTALACGQVRYLREGWDASLSLVDQSDRHPARPVATRATIDRDHPELFWSLNFATRAATWRALGGFDQGYAGYGAEDTDLGRRAHAAGIPLLWLPGALAYHQWHAPTRLDRARTAEIVANARRFRDRWGEWPMGGWLTELAARGWLRFEPDRDVLEVAT